MKKTILLSAGIALLTGMNACEASKVASHTTFMNQTSQPVVQTKTPYLDNFSLAIKNPDFSFAAPGDTVAPQATTEAITSHPRSFQWYSASQYVYNYAGRSAEYGCFVTELRLSGNPYIWSPNKFITIASYRADPAFPNDYLTCNVKADPNDKSRFYVQFLPTAEDHETNDMTRFSIAGNTEELNHLTEHQINRPIILNPTLMLSPNQSQPEIMSQNANASNPLPSDQIITVINHTQETLVPGTLLFDRFSRLNDKYSYYQTAEILPNQQGEIRVNADSYLQRFNYHGKGKNEKFGCFITVNVPKKDTSILDHYSVGKAQDPFVAPSTLSQYVDDINNKLNNHSLMCFVNQKQVDVYYFGITHPTPKIVYDSNKCLKNRNGCIFNSAQNTDETVYYFTSLETNFFVFGWAYHFPIDLDGNALDGHY